MPSMSAIDQNLAPVISVSYGFVRTGDRVSEA